jgi:hypothetical protein
VLMGRSEPKAAYHLLGLIGALVMGCLLVVVLMGPMGAAQANQQRPHANKVEQKKNETVQVTAAGQNNYRAKGDDNPIVYKSADSRSGFDGGFYRHVLRCEPGYKAIGGGWDFNNPDAVYPYWQILASRHDNGGETWLVEAYGNTVF